VANEAELEALGEAPPQIRREIGISTNESRLGTITRLIHVAVGCRAEWLLAIGIWASVLIQPSSAQGEAVACGAADLSLLEQQLKTAAPVEARPVTRFLTAGGVGELAVKHPLNEPNGDVSITRARVFDTNETTQAPFKSNRELPVLSIQRAPEPSEPGAVAGFRPTDSIVVRFDLPETSARSLWQRRNLVAIGCHDNTLAAWGIARAHVSNGIIVSTISTLVIVLLYSLFTLAVFHIRNRDYPLAPKYPAYASIEKYSFWEYLFNPVRLTANAFNQASVQKLQILMFSFLVGGMLLSLVLKTGGLSDLSITVAGLLGISGVGAAAAQATNSNRERMNFDNWVWLVRKQVLPIHQVAVQAPSWGDLVRTNREFDVYKLQTLLFSLVVAAALLVGGESGLATFTVPETLLGILGLSQVVYLAGILVRPPSVGDLNEALTKLRQLETTLQIAVAHNADTDEKGKLPEPLPPADPAATAAQRKARAVNATKLYNEQADQVEVMIESALEVEVNREKLNPSLT
jgi:hypothetical protein